MHFQPHLIIFETNFCKNLSWNSLPLLTQAHSGDHFWAKPLYLSWSHSGTQYMTQQTSFSFMVPLSSFSSESKKAEWLTGWLTGFRGGGSIKRKSTIQYERNLLRYRPQLFQKLSSDQIKRTGTFVDLYYFLFITKWSITQSLYFHIQF